MASNKQKGDKAEREVYKIIESTGWIVNPAPRTMQRVFAKGKLFYVSRRNDHWGLFDGEARKRKEKVHFQVKAFSEENVFRSKPKIEEFYKEYCCEHETCQIWLRVARKGFVIYTLEHNYHGKCMSVDGKVYHEFGDYLWIKSFINLKGKTVEPFKITGD